MRVRSVLGVVAAGALLTGLVGPAPVAQAVNAAHSVMVSANPSNLTPDVLDGKVNAIALVGTKVVIGGTFTRIQNPGGGTVNTQPYLAAFDAATGVVDPAFDPAVDGEIKSLEAVGASVVAAGEFRTVNGVAWRGVVKLTAAGDREPGWVGQLTDGIANTVLYRGGKLFLGGRFSKVNGSPRSAFAVLSPTTGALDPAFVLSVAGTRKVGSPTAVQVIEVSPDGRTLVMSGNFTVVGGQARNQIAVVDVTTRTVTSWATTEYAEVCQPDFTTSIRSIDYAPDGSYFVVVAAGGTLAGALCDSASRWEHGRTGAGQLPTWTNFSGGDSLTSGAVTGAAVYVGGHQKWMNSVAGVLTQTPSAVDRPGLAALDPLSGVPMSWNPTRIRGLGVFDMVASPTGLWIGHDTETVGNPAETRMRVGFFPIAGGTEVPRAQPATLPKNLFIAGTDGSLKKRSYTGTSFGPLTSVTNPGSVPWATVNGAFMAAGKVYYARADGTLWAAPFNGSTVGASVDLGSWFSFTDVKGLTYDRGRMYYTTGDGRLYYRGFALENGLVGAQAVTAATSGYTDAKSLFVANNSLYFVRSGDGRLYRVALTTTGLPTGAATAVSGPGIDSVSWNVRAAFLSSVPLESLVRLYGLDRVETSLAASRDLYPSALSAGAVVLARSDVFADGLAGAPLAAARNAPLLLTAPTALDARSEKELIRVLARGKKVYLLGGAGALSAAVASRVQALGYVPVRLAGSDRFTTAIEIAKQLPTANKALLATGTSFADALGAGAAAGANNGIVLLTNGSTLPTSVRSYLTGRAGIEVWAVGGPAVTAAGSLVTSSTRKVSGADRYETATLLATKLFPSPSKVTLATGANFPDGLSGGAYAAGRGAPLLLVSATALPASASAYLRAHAGTIDGGAVFGGPLVIGQPVVASAEVAIS